MTKSITIKKILLVKIIHFFIRFHFSLTKKCSSYNFTEMDLRAGMGLNT